MELGKNPCLPRLAMPSPATPYRAVPCLTLPCPAAPDLAISLRTKPVGKPPLSLRWNDQTGGDRDLAD